MNRETYGNYEVFYIKKKNGYRRIAAPSPELKAKQRDLLPFLYSDFNFHALSHDVHECFHGFLPERGAKTAASKHVGYKATIMMDISNFFDSVQIDDVKDYIRCSITDMHIHDGSIGQGFCTSPILANIYLVKVVYEIQKVLRLHERVTKHKYCMTVYADDIQISTNDSSKKNIDGIITLVEQKLKKYKLSINKRKTRVRYAKHGYRKILGVAVGDNHTRSTRRHNRKIRAAKHQKNGPSLGGLISYQRYITQS